MSKYEDNDLGNTDKMNWYKGKTLLESLNEIKPVKRDFDKPLLISIFKSYDILGGTVLRGKILSGKFTKKEPIILNSYYSTITTKINSIQIYDNKVDEAVAGDIISFQLKVHLAFNETKNIKLLFPEWPEDLLYIDKFKQIKYTPKKSFRAKIFMVNKKAALKNGYTLTFFCYSLNLPINIKKIEYLVDGANKILKKEPEEIKYGNYAIVIIEIIQGKVRSLGRGVKNIILQEYINNPFLGSFELFNDYFIAVGKIIDF